MMDKQVENVGIKCIEMTFALYNSDISTHIKIDSPSLQDVSDTPNTLPRCRSAPLLYSIVT